MAHSSDQQVQGSGLSGDLNQNLSIERLAQTFENSARRWELIVYPSLFAFIILAAYGFYLIYSLTKDVHYLAVSVDTNMTILATNMDSVSQNLGEMKKSVGIMSMHMEEINQKVGAMEPMLVNLKSMDQSIRSMTVSTYNMRTDLARMNNSISRPMSFMNTFLPS